MTALLWYTVACSGLSSKSSLSQRTKPFLVSTAAWGVKNAVFTSACVHPSSHLSVGNSPETTFFELQSRKIENYVSASENWFSKVLNIIELALYSSNIMSCNWYTGKIVIVENCHLPIGAMSQIRFSIWAASSPNLLQNVRMCIVNISSFLHCTSCFVVLLCIVNPVMTFRVVKICLLCERFFVQFFYFSCKNFRNFQNMN